MQSGAHISLPDKAGGSFIPPMKGELRQQTVLSMTEPTALAGDYLYF